MSNIRGQFIFRNKYFAAFAFNYAAFAFNLLIYLYTTFNPRKILFENTYPNYANI